MDKKKWFQSKTIWAGIIGVVIAVYNSVVSSMGAGCGVEGGLCIVLPVVPEFIYGILGALGVYSRAASKTVIK